MMHCKFCEGSLGWLEFLLQQRICDTCEVGIRHFEQDRTTYDPRKTCKNCHHHHFNNTKKCGVTIFLKDSEIDHEYEYCGCVDEVRKHA